MTEANIETKNARIHDAVIEIEDHGILTAVVYLDYGGSCQGFGGYGFDYRPKGVWIASGFGAWFIRNVLEIADVRKWEDLKGQCVRVKSTHSKVHAIGHILKDKWFDPSSWKEDSDVRQAT